jgi:hypothetical protein
MKGRRQGDRGKGKYREERMKEEGKGGINRGEKGRKRKE